MSKRLMPISILVVMLCLAVYMGKGIAELAQTSAVEAVIKAQWDKPNHPVKVPVVAMSGQHAIADWIQDARGGRALLMMHDGKWQTMMCGDGNMKQLKHLLEAGVPAKDAEAIIESLNSAEAKLPAEDLRLINSFKGMVDLLKEPAHHGQHH